MDFSLLVQSLTLLGEGVGIPLFLTFILSQIKNPQTAALYKTSLIGAANAIYQTFGMTPPQQ